MDTHLEGDKAELKIASIALDKGYKVSFPFGHNCRYDLILDNGSKLERIQIKTTSSYTDVLKVHTRSLGKRDGKQIRKLYTSEEIDAIIILDRRTGKCYYLPIRMVEGKDTIILRFIPTKNGQTKSVHYARDFEW